MQPIEKKNRQARLGIFVRMAYLVEKQVGPMGDWQVKEDRAKKKMKGLTIITSYMLAVLFCLVLSFVLLAFHTYMN